MRTLTGSPDPTSCLVSCVTRMMGNNYISRASEGDDVPDNLSHFRPRMRNPRSRDDAQLLDDLFDAAEVVHAAKGRFTSA